jgi:hypothetical protein
MNSLMPLVGARQLDSVRVHQFDGFHREQLADCRFGNDWFVFTAVRHPIDRAVSAWRDKVGNPEQKNVLRKNGIKPGDSFEYFVKVISLWPKQALDAHVIPQSTILHYAKDAPINIFRFENLNTQWNIIAREIERRSGLKAAPLGRINASNAPRPKIAPDSAKKLYRLYAEDLARWYNDAP